MRLGLGVGRRLLAQRVELASVRIAVRRLVEPGLVVRRVERAERRRDALGLLVELAAGPAADRQEALAGHRGAQQRGY